MSQVAPGVTIPLKGDASDFTSAVAKVQAELETLEAEVAKLDRTLADSTKTSKMSAAELKNMEKAAAAAKDRISQLRDVSQKLSQAQGDMAAVSSKLGGQVQQVGRVFNDLSGALGQNGSEMAKLTKGVGSLGNVLTDTFSAKSPYMMAGVAFVGVLSMMKKHFDEVKEAAKAAAEEASKRLAEARGEADALALSLTAFRLGVSEKQLQRGQSLQEKNERAGELIQQAGGAGRAKRAMTDETLFKGLPKEQQAAITELKALGEEIAALNSTIADDTRLQKETAAKMHEQAIQDAHGDVANKAQEKENAEKKKREEEHAAKLKAFKLEEEKTRSFIAWYSSNMGTTAAGTMAMSPLQSDGFNFTEVAPWEGPNVQGIDELGVEASLASKAMKTLRDNFADFELELSTFGGVDPMDRLMPSERARVEDQDDKHTLRDALDIQDFIDKLKDPMSDVAKGMSKMAEETDKAAKETRGFGSMLADAAQDLALSAIEGGAGGLGAAAGGLVGGAVDMAMGGTGEIGGAIGSLLGSILGDALDELIDALGVLSPLFDGLAVLIAALQPILIVIEELMVELGMLLIAIAPLLLALAKPIAAIVLIVVRLIQVLLPFINIIIGVVAGIVMLLDFITLGIKILDDNFFRPLITGARQIYNGFVDVVNTIVMWIRSVLNWDGFGVIMDKMDPYAGAVIDDFASSIGDLKRLNIEEAKARKDNIRGMQDFDTELSNMPSGFKAAGLIFDAAEATTRGPIGGGGGGMPHTGPVNITIERWVSGRTTSEDIAAIRRLALSGDAGTFTTRLSRRTADDEVG